MIKQIIAVIGNYCLKEHCNSGTYTIIISVYQVLEHLVTAYGMVNSCVLYIEEAKLKALFWNLSDPPVQIYNAIEYLFYIKETANLSNSTE